MMNLVATFLAAMTSTAAVSEDTSADTSTGNESKTLIEEPKRIRFGIYGAFGAALQNAAIAGSLGFRYRVADHFLVGLDGEYNPWLSRSTGQLRPGVANAYATLILRFPMQFERVNLRSTLHAGVSRLLFDLYGAPKGSMGPYIGVNLLGLDYELGNQLYLVVDPADIAVPIPQTKGTPLAFPQYRITIGVQWGA